jgi:hypothetical protein
MDIPFMEKALAYLRNPTATAALGAPHIGLPHRVGTKVQRKLAAKLRKQEIHTPTRTLIKGSINGVGLSGQTPTGDKTGPHSI